MATRPTWSTCEVAATNTTLTRSARENGAADSGSGIVSNGVPARRPSSSSAGRDPDNIGRTRSTVAEVMNATAMAARNSSASHSRAC